jgi:hypothetical protein
VDLVGVLIACRGNAAQDLPQFRLIVDELQQRSSSRTAAADAEDVFGGGVEVGYE